MMDLQLFPVVIVLAFVCELVDSTLGMGYGTSLTPILLLLGYQPAEIVPAVLFSEFVTGVLAGVLHHEFGNVDFHVKSRDFRVMGLMTVLSVVGVLSAVFIAVRLPTWAIKVYIGILVTGIGVALLWGRNRQFHFSWGRVAGLGLLAAFNKGISGGGYGPVVTGGQVLTGISPRSAIGIASLAEGITSAVGVLAYLSSGAAFPVLLTPSLLLGAVLSVPLAAFAVSKAPDRSMPQVIGGVSTALGAFTLLKLVI